jgi:hypothetical protein
VPLSSHAFVALALVAATAGHASAQPASSARVDSHWFHDPTVEVATVGGRARQDLGRGISVTFGLLADRIAVRAADDEEDEEEEEEEDDDDERSVARVPTADAVSSASTATVAAAGPEWRVAGDLGLRYRTGLDTPFEVGARASTSVEDDYRSLAGQLDAVVELRERTVVLSGFAGAGRDRSLPLEDLAPDSASTRYFGGASVGFVTTPRLVLHAGASVTHQGGQLASPYRVALVGGAEVPEVLPSTRTRFTGYVGAAWAVSDGTAVHGRAGLYADTWRVLAAIPEVAVARELGAHALVTLGYRLYRQRAASFHRATYTHVEPYLSGDPRLAALADHTMSLDLAWRWEGDDADHAVILRASYALSALTRDVVDAGVELAHVLGVGVGGEY